jgi:hypothetical protein
VGFGQPQMPGHNIVHIRERKGETVLQFDPHMFT